MRIESESTLDEAVEAQMRLMAKTCVARTHNRQALVVAPAMFIGAYLAIPDEQTVKLAFASLTFVGYIVAYLMFRRAIVRAYYRRFLIDQRGTAKPIAAEYVLDDEGLTCKQVGTEVKLSWDIIEQVVEDEKYVEVSAGKIGIVLISRDSFATDREQQDWIQMARSKMRACAGNQ